MGKAKITITIDEHLIETIDHLSEKEGKSRSQLMEEAVMYWHHWQIEQDLIEGYRAMAKEDVETAESHLSAGIETHK
ncbi:MAG: CopG family transcriptional regulator [Nitrospirae bacterium]|nr:CopG family transcriptional regulator [Nitrospirota bacterium]